MLLYKISYEQGKLIAEPYEQTEISAESKRTALD